MKTVKLNRKGSKNYFYNAEQNILKTATRGSFGYKYSIGVDGCRLHDKTQPSRSRFGHRYYSHSIAQMAEVGYILITQTDLVNRNGLEHEYLTDSLYL